MNKFLHVSRYVFIALCVLSLTAGKSYAGWHELTQSDRNQRIVAQAQYDLGKVGGACIIWVRDVVRVASNQAGGPGIPVLIPNATAWNGVPDEGYQWLSDPNVTSYGSLPLGSVVPGMIIQMRTSYKSGGYGPHTAIVLANSPGTSQLTLIESNYTIPYTVTTRPISYAAFYQLIESTYHYTVYTIH